MDVVPFGKSTTRVTRVGLGGEGILRTRGRNRESLQVIHTALEEGIRYFDTAPAYADSEAYYGAYWSAHPGTREKVFHTSKSAERTRIGALKDLEKTLARLNTDFLDLWQIHDLRTSQDFDEISRKDGALEAFIEAREKGVVRYIGVTGHHDPSILTRAVTEWPVDAVLMPVNPVEASIGGFLTHTLEAALRKNIAVIAMKVLGGSHYIAPQIGVTSEILVRFALCHDVTLAIVGASSPDEVRRLVHAAALPPLSPNDVQELVQKFKPAAKRLAFYRGAFS